MAPTLSASDGCFAMFGGFLLSLSTTFHLIMKGRVTGMSGIFYSLFTFEKESFIWKLNLVAGMLFMSALFMLTAGTEKIVNTESTIFEKV